MGWTLAPKSLNRNGASVGLRLLVDTDLRARFDKQQENLLSAIAAGDEEQIVVHATAMSRGWDARATPC
jgi:hypothetical protein